MKVSELVAMQPSLIALANIKLPVKVSYRISKILNQIGGVIKQVNADQRALYQSMGVLNEDKTQFVIPDEHRDAFNAAMQGLMDVEANITIHPVSAADLGDISIEPGHLALLSGFVLADAPVLSVVPAVGGDADTDPTAA